MEKDNFKKKAPSAPPALDDIDLMHLLVENGQSLASTIGMYNSQNTTVLKQVNQVQAVPCQSHLDTCLQEA